MTTLETSERSAVSLRVVNVLLQFARVAAIVCAYLVLVEGMAFLAASVLAQRNLLYYPPTPAQIAHYEDEQDPILGWPSKRMLAEGFDERGARVNPFFPLPHEACISVYGGSFTYGVHVSDEGTWAAMLSQHLGCRVANYGVTGYGTDQAYLRYSLNRADNAPVVVLTHFSGDIRRNVNQFRNLLSPHNPVQLKPRFVFEQGLLTYIPPPRVSHDQVFELINSPSRVVLHEYFLPGVGSGVIEAKFPFTFAVGKLFFSRELQSRMQHAPLWAEFYDPSHPSKALQVTVGIIERFVHEAKQRGQEPVVAIAPDPSEFFYSAVRGEFVYKPLKQELARRGIEVFDIGDRLLEATRGQSPCFIASGFDCSGGLSAAGNRLVASIIGGMFRGIEPSRVELLQAASAVR